MVANYQYLITRDVTRAASKLVEAINDRSSKQSKQQKGVREVSAREFEASFKGILQDLKAATESLKGEVSAWKATKIRSTCAKVQGNVAVGRGSGGKNPACPRASRNQFSVIKKDDRIVLILIKNKKLLAGNEHESGRMLKFHDKFSSNCEVWISSFTENDNQAVYLGSDETYFVQQTATRCLSFETQKIYGEYHQPAGASFDSPWITYGSWEEAIPYLQLRGKSDVNRCRFLHPDRPNYVREMRLGDRFVIAALLFPSSNCPDLYICLMEDIIFRCDYHPEAHIDMGKRIAEVTNNFKDCIHEFLFVREWESRILKRTSDIMPEAWIDYLNVYFEHFVNDMLEEPEEDFHPDYRNHFEYVMQFLFDTPRYQDWLISIRDRIILTLFSRWRYCYYVMVFYVEKCGVCTCNDLLQYAINVRSSDVAESLVCFGADPLSCWPQIFDCFSSEVLAHFLKMKDFDIFDPDLIKSTPQLADFLFCSEDTRIWYHGHWGNLVIDLSVHESFLLREAAKYENKYQYRLRMALDYTKTDPSACNNEAIRNAVKFKRLENVKVLLADPRVDPSACDNEALRHAVQNRDFECVKLLLADPRVNPSACDNEALRHAVQNRDFECVKLLLADPRVNPSACDNEALRHAVQNRDFECVKLLLTDPRVDPSVCNNEASKCAYEDTACIELLLAGLLIDR